MDLISRQEAINLINVRLSQPCKNLTSEFKKGMEDGYYRIRSDIKRMPSAQPDIVRCKDCKYQRKGQNECEAWNLCGYRPWQYTPITDEHFCSYAEREEDA